MYFGGPNPIGQGQAGYQAIGNKGQNSFRQQKVIVFHGTSDTTVNIINGQQIVSQMAETLDLLTGYGQAKGIIPQNPTYSNSSTSKGGMAYNEYTYVNASSGKPTLKFIKIQGMGHGWSGGSSQGTYTVPNGPNASLMMINFFLGNGPTPSTTSSTSGIATTTGTPASTTGVATTQKPTPTGKYKKISLPAINRDCGYTGIYLAWGAGNTECKAGSAVAANEDTFRGILTFDSSSIKGRKIISGYLKFTKLSIGEYVTSISLDIKRGCFSESCDVTLSEYSSSADMTSVMTTSSLSNSLITMDIPQSAFQYFTGSHVSFRIRATAEYSIFEQEIHIDAGINAANPPTIVLNVA